MMRSIYTKTLYDLRWSILAFAVGLALLAFFVLYVYPSFADAQGGLFSGLEDQTSQALLGTIAANTPEAYLNVQLFSFQPLYIAIFLIIATSSAVAGEDNSKTLGTLLAHPVSRWRVLTEKALAMFTGMLIIELAIAAGAVIGAYVAGVDLDLLKLALALLAVIPYGVFLLGFGLFCSSFFRSRMVAALVATSVVVSTYVLNSLTEFVLSLKTYNQFAPMYYYSWGEPLVGPLDWGDVLILVAAGVVFYLFAIVAFQRREVLG
jgi:ABC-2 type transport system permease protein